NEAIQYWKPSINNWSGISALGDDASTTYALQTYVRSDDGFLNVDDPENYGNVYTRLTVMPEPATMTLLALGGLGMLRRRKRRS
ncbi:MAG TPA: PEP-CTERM sorting domain-containing protein, partial [Phycisphaerae bacterium]|nr:PEP-CTERM sorting domain-containing protein [Phycisphaerae bacterium]